MRRSAENHRMRPIFGCGPDEERSVLAMSKRWIGGATCLLAFGACGGEPSEAVVPECSVSLTALAQELSLPEGATVQEVYAGLKSVKAPSPANRTSIRLVEELHFRELGLQPAAWFGESVLASLSCGAAAPPALDAVGCDPGISTLKTAVAGCQRLLADHVPSSGMDDLYDECLGQLRDGYASVEGTTCEGGVRDAVTTVAAAVMAKANAPSHDYAERSALLRKERRASEPSESSLLDDNDPRLADIQRRLSVVDSWLAFQLDFGLGLEELPRSLSDIWLDAYALPTLDSEEEQYEPGQVLGLLDQMDQFLLAEAVKVESDSTTGAYHPLMRLNIASIALARLSKELQTRAEVVNVVCRLGDCSSGNAVKDVAQAVLALRDASLTIPTGATLGSRASDWLDSLREVHPRASLLTSALAAYPQDSNAQLLNAMNNALALRYQQLVSGPADRFPLATRLHDENRTQIRFNFTARRLELGEDVDLYNSARVAFAQSQVAELGARSSTVGLANQLLRAVETLADDEVKIAGVQRLYDGANDRWAAGGDFVSRVEALGLEGEINVAPGTTPVAVPLPVSAKYQVESGIATAANLPARDVHAWQVAQGDTLRFTVSGQWSPTCSLRSASLNDNELLAGASVNYALTGPEGYYLQSTSSGFKATSTTEANSDVTAAGVCRSLSGAAIAAITAITAGVAPSERPDPAILQYLGFWSSVGDFFAAAPGYLGDCVEGLLGGGSSGSQSTTGGAESSHSAAFSAGIRLTNTPFPTLPAGSLVLATVSGGAIVDATVVRANSAIQAPATGTAHLVVNDIHCDESSGTLTVEWAQGQSLAGRAKELAKAMTSIAVDSRELIETIAAAGVFTSADADSFRASARQALRESCGNCDIENRFPSGVIGMFEEWLAYQTAQLQRRVDIRRMQFDVRLQASLITTLAEQLALERAGGRWTEHLKQMAFTELSETSIRRLEDSMQAAISYLDQRILPILQVRYPEVIKSVGATRITAATELDQSIWTLAEQVRTLVYDLDRKLADASTGAKGENVTPVLLWIPKPGEAVEFENGAVRVLVADEDDIAAVWTETDNGYELASNAHLRVNRHELYTNRSDIVDRLACGRTAPIIAGMMLYAVDERSPYAGRPLEDPMSTSRFSVSVDIASPVFVSADGPKAYDLLAGNAGEVRVARGTFSDRRVVAEAFLPYENSLLGLSPFLDLQLRGSSDLNESLRNASGLALIMNVSSYTADTGISHCR